MITSVPRAGAHFIRKRRPYPKLARPTILNVDDDREVTQYLSDVLKGEGWKVLCEKDGDWALKTFKSRRIDARGPRGSTELQESSRESRFRSRHTTLD